MSVIYDTEAYTEYIAYTTHDESEESCGALTRRKLSEWAVRNEHWIDIATCMIVFIVQLLLGTIAECIAQRHVRLYVAFVFGLPVHLAVIANGQSAFVSRLIAYVIVVFSFILYASVYFSQLLDTSAYDSTVLFIVGTVGLVVLHLPWSLWHSWRTSDNFKRSHTRSYLIDSEMTTPSSVHYQH